MRRPNAEAIARILDCQEEIVAAAPVIHELWFGCYRLKPSRKRALLDAYLGKLSAVPVLPYDARAARWHAEERARLETVGQAPSFVDGQIAAIARVNDLVLVTRNVGDFARFAGLEIEDWFLAGLGDTL